MRRRRNVTILVPSNGRNVLVRGHDRRDLQGIRGMWSPKDRGLWVHRSRLPDVLAALEVAGCVVDVIDDGVAA